MSIKDDFDQKWLAQAGKEALRVVSVGVFMWLLAGLWHELVAASLYARAGHESHDGIFVLLVSYVILSALMTTLHRRDPSPKRSSVRAGLVFGALIGVLWVMPHELALAAAHGTSYSYVWKNAAWHVVEQGLGGALLARLAPSMPGRKVVLHARG